MGALADAREVTAFAPRAGRAHVVAQLLTVDGVTQRATVSIDNSPPVTLPFAGAAADYSGITTVLCACNPTDGGRAVFVLAPVGAQIDPPVAPVAAVSAPAVAGIGVVGSGTWRASRGAWDRYTGGDGALSDLYQGPAATGGDTLLGWCGYGDQIVGLGATTITSITVIVTRVGTGTTGGVALTVQGSPSGTRPAGAPGHSGETASVTLTRGATGTITLTAAMCEALRTGAAKGLCLVGGAYAGAKGVTVGGMSARVSYTRPA